MLSRVPEKRNQISLVFGACQRCPAAIPPTVLLSLDRRPLPTKGPNAMHGANGKWHGLPMWNPTSCAKGCPCWGATRLWQRFLSFRQSICIVVTDIALVGIGTCGQRCSEPAIPRVRGVSGLAWQAGGPQIWGFWWLRPLGCGPGAFL